MVECIITNRRGLKQYYWHIVYEWENVLSAHLRAPLITNPLSLRYVRGLWRRIFRKVSNLPITRKSALAFVMRPNFWDENIAGKHNIIPVIIDFWLRTDAEIDAFERRYLGNPAVLITSREVFDFLKTRVKHIKIYHWALSLPDIYYNVPVLPKKYDCACVGRLSTKLKEWMLRYASENPGFVYLFNDRRVGSDRIHYVSSDGEDLNKQFESRAGYFDILRQTKVGLYSTPSMDNDKIKSNGIDSNAYNQVTPRLLEYLAAGCRVIARYPKNPDTEWYQLDDVATNVDSYEQFKLALDKCLSDNGDSANCSSYLKRHLTSARAMELKQIMECIEKRNSHD